MKDLKREIGLLGFSSHIVNTVIGAGIFVLPAIVAADLGPASILAYVFCGILITLMMLCFAEVGSKITDTGGVYIYIEKSFGKYPGFLTAVLMLLATLTADAAVANAIVAILFKLLPGISSEAVRILFFVLLFGSLAYINVKGVKKSVGFVKLITILKIVPLLLIVFIGFIEVDMANLVWESVPSIQKIGTTSLILFFAFAGAGSALSVSGEVREPQRTIPRGILISTFLIGLIYVLVQTVSQGVLGPALPTFSENPLGEVASQIFGPIGFTLLTIGAAVSMFGGISSKVLSMPRILLAASRDDVIPVKMLSRIHDRFNTPYVSIIAYAMMGFLFASAGGFKQLAIVSSASSLIIALGISIATIKLRKQKKFDKGPENFKIPGGFTVPVLSSVFIIWFLSNLSSNKIFGFGIFVVFLTIVYLLINLKLIKPLFKRKVT